MKILLSKNDFMLTSIGLILKSLRKNHLAKKRLLTGKKISYKEYEHIVEIWNKLN